MSRILIVEDDRPFAEALASTLRLEGHDVLVAVTADEGVRLGLASRPDLIVADWMLRSELHGGEVCQRIHAACPWVKTIIITGCADVVAQAERWCPCVEAVLEKPFHTEEVIQTVNRALAGTTLPMPETHSPLTPAFAPA